MDTPLRSVLLSNVSHIVLATDKGDKNASCARTRENVGVTLSDKVARGRARRITVTITVAGARGDILN